MPITSPKVSLTQTATVLISPAPFKGSLSAAEAAEAIAQGIHDVLPDARMILLPLSDGGEGLVPVLGPALGARMISTSVHGPLPGDRVDAVWALALDGQTAVIEMASAAGLPLVPEKKRDPGLATTQGVGELILAALDAGASRIILGLGGSATNDGGAGMASVLGYRLLDRDGRPLTGGGMALARLARIDASNSDWRLEQSTFIAACDVTNPLIGPDGAAMVYGPQKGGSSATLTMLDNALAHFAEVIRRDLGVDMVNVPGAGAAGGMGGGVMAFLHGTLARGIEVVLDAVQYDNTLRSADLVVTGEGRLDDQTRRGKVITGILQRTAPLGIPVIAIAGSSSFPSNTAGALPGLTDLVTLAGGETTVEQAIREAPRLLRERTREVLRRYLSP